jgi:energy-coupling factor transporter ATP-binding protein EcfA2
MPPALRIENVWKSYSAGVRGCSARAWVLRGCTLRVELGERVAIVGARGSGKSTLLQCISGARRTDAGSVTAHLPVHGCLSTALTTAAVSTYASGPVLLLVDGPSSAQLPATWNGSILLSSHDVASVYPCVDRVLLLRDGHLRPLSRPAVRRVAERPFDSATHHDNCLPIELQCIDRPAEA